MLRTTRANGDRRIDVCQQSHCSLGLCSLPATGSSQPCCKTRSRNCATLQRFPPSRAESSQKCHAAKKVHESMQNECPFSSIFDFPKTWFPQESKHRSEEVLLHATCFTKPSLRAVLTVLRCAEPLIRGFVPKGPDEFFVL